ncbi:MAG: hypothetical protein LAT58_04915 [Opitutales bacterium]|nr:hypothetical protein [Opitutales bacterium]
MFVRNFFSWWALVRFKRVMAKVKIYSVLIAVLSVVPLTANTEVDDEGFLNSRPLVSFTFQEPVPAYHPEDKTNYLGDFQSGLTVDVLGVNPVDGFWTVSYDRTDQEPIKALIPIPRVDSENPILWDNFKQKVEEFPLLLALFEDPQRVLWKGKKPELGDMISTTLNANLTDYPEADRWRWSYRHFTIWGQDVNALQILSGENDGVRLRFVFEREYPKTGFDSDFVRDMTVLRRNLQRPLQALADMYDRRQRAYWQDESGENETLYFLPNFILVRLEYDLRQIFLTVEPYVIAPGEIDR